LPGPQMRRRVVEVFVGCGGPGNCGRSRYPSVVLNLTLKAMLNS
jgi:hypothetical protein